MSRALGVLLLGALAVAVAAMLLWQTNAGAENQTGVQFHIAVDTGGDPTDDCSTEPSGTMKCAIEQDAAFDVKVYLDDNSDLGYDGWEGFFTYAGVTPDKTSDSTPWPGCVGPPAGFAVYDHNAAAQEVAFGCAAGIGADPSTYEGLLGSFGMTCDESGTVTMRHGGGESGLVTATGNFYEAKPGAEQLTINCGGLVAPTSTATATATSAPPTNTPPPTATPLPPTDTPTPGGPTSTPTATPVPPTPTNTPLPTATHTPAGAPDLVVSKEASPEPIAGDETVTYTIEVRNDGNLGANFVRLIDTPPDNFTITGFGTDRGACVIVGAPTGGRLDCDLGNFGTGPAAVAHITLLGHYDKVGTAEVVNSVEVDPEDTIAESNEGNNTDTESSTVQGPTPTPTALAEDQAKEEVSPGGKVTTDAELDGATGNDPVETSVTVTAEGKVSIHEVAITQPNPAGFVLFGQQVNITAPPGTVENPLVITFFLDDSIIPEGQTHQTIQVFRNGLRVPTCTTTSGAAQPNPCVAKRNTLVGAQAGDVQLVVLTTQASAWNFGRPSGIAPTPTPTGTPPPGGFTQGDVNGDGLIESIDAWWVLLEVVGLVDEVPVPQAADVDKDGDRDSTDSLIILQFVAGLVDGFGPG